jgi:aryl-alcohol dehydrogenase-like predicted oxidoreductase
LKARRLGSTDLTVSEIGLGCQSLGGGLHHGGTRAALDLVAAALDTGITYFDTSDHYGLGQSEAVLGRGLRSVRDRVVIASKAGTYYTPSAKVALRARLLAKPFKGLLRPFRQRLDRIRSTQRRGDFSLSYLRNAVEGSLRRLRIDYLDLLYLHKPTPEILRSDETRSTMETLCREGKVRYVGVSCESVEDTWLSLDLPNVAAVQLTINLLERRGIDLLPRALERGIGVIARNPRAAGLLTQARSDVTGETYAVDRRAFEAAQRAAASFAFLATESRTLSQAAIQFVLQLPGVATTIPRALNAEQLMEIVRAAALPRLTDAELERIQLAAGNVTGTIRRYAYRSQRPERAF